MLDNRCNPEEPAEEISPSESNDEPLSEDQAAEANAEAQLYYKRLEQEGKLVDIDGTTDLANLPPHVTHIRRPDGSIERLGYS